MPSRIRLYHTFTSMISGVSCLEVACDDRSVVLKLWPDLDDPTNKPDWQVTLPKASTWREICVALVAAEYAYAFNADDYRESTFPWPSEMRVKGPRTLATTMISWAWAGPPLTEIVTALSGFKDPEVRRLLRDLGPMTSREAFIRLVRWRFLLEQNGLSIAQVLSVHRLADADQSLLRSVISVVRKAHTARWKKEKSRRLLPTLTRRQIKDLAERVAGPTTTGMLAMASRASKVSAICAYIEDYLIDSGGMPTGSHFIPAISATIDFS